MADYERRFETQHPADRLGTAILQLGIKPELAVELEPSEARVVVSALAKALSTLVHPDRGARDEIFGLSVGDINYLGSLVSQADDTELGHALGRIAETSADVSTKKQNQLLGEELARVAEVNNELAHAVIHGQEAVSDRISMSFLLLEPNAEHPDDLGNQAVSVRVHNGVITEALAVKARGSLLSAFPEHIQEKLLELRPNLDSSKPYIHLDTLFPDDESMRGWAQLVTATSRKDSGVKKPAIKLYSADDESYEITDLVGARVVGSFAYSARADDGFALSIDTPFQDDIQESAGAGSSAKTYYRVRNEELAHLFGRSHARVLDTVRAVETAERLVFHQPTGRGRDSTNFITTDIVARILL